MTKRPDEPAEPLGPTPHKYDTVVPNYRGNENHLGIYKLRDKRNRKTMPQNQVEGTDFDVHDTSGGY